MEMFIGAVMLGIGSALAAMFSLYRTMGLRFIAKHSSKIDIAATCLYILLLTGTSTMGIFAAMFAGLFTAFFVDGAKRFYLMRVAAGKAPPLEAPKPLRRIDIQRMDVEELRQTALARVFGTEHRPHH